MDPIIFSACEVPDALKYMSKPTICRRCGAATVDLPAAEVSISSGSGWSARTRTITLCDHCGDQLERWLVSGQHSHHDGPGGALASTAVASMALATS